MKIPYRTSPSLAGFILFTALFIEIAGFIIVGKYIGVLATLLLIILSMILGFALLKIQGITLLTKVRSELSAGYIPDRELAHGALMMLAAILLIIPGFVSDIIGLLLFIPFIRDIIWRFFSNKIEVRTSFDENSRDNNGPTIDLDADNYHSTHPERSPWRKDDDFKQLK